MRFNWKAVIEERDSRINNRDWAGAMPEVFVALYVSLHSEVYKVAPTFKPGEKGRAVDAAKEALREHFGGDGDGLADYMRWVWSRQAAEEKKRRAGAKDGSFRVTWKYQWSPTLITDYRVASLRAGDPDPLPPATTATELDEGSSWRDALTYTKTGLLKKNVANIVTILVHDDRWRGVLAYDEFAEGIVSRGPPPWHADDAPSALNTGDWTDDDITRVCAWLSREYELDSHPNMALSAIAVVARRTPIHPVRDWLRGLVWDAIPRIDRWLTDFCGASDTPYVRAVGSMTLISAVARVEKPGSKVDTTLTLQGSQGIGKSRLIRALFGDEWTCETQGELGTKDALQILRRKWVVELPELDALSRSEATRVKAFLSSQVDTYRASYGRCVRDYPRQCVLIGTTNAEQYLKDETGARRFWPVRVRQIDVEGLRQHRDQIWAEAHARYAAGEPWHMTASSVLRDAEEEQSDRYCVDPWEVVVREWLNDPFQAGAERRRNGVTTTDVLMGALRMLPARMTRADKTRVGASLRRLGWTSRQIRRGGARVRVYQPPEVVPTGGDVTEVATGSDMNPEVSVIPSQPSQPDPHTDEKAESNGAPDLEWASMRSGRDSRDGCDVAAGPRRLRIVPGGGP